MKGWSVEEVDDSNNDNDVQLLMIVSCCVCHISDGHRTVFVGEFERTSQRNSWQNSARRQYAHMDQGISVCLSVCLIICLSVSLSVHVSDCLSLPCCHCLFLFSNNNF